MFVFVFFIKIEKGCFMLRTQPSWESVRGLVDTNKKVGFAAEPDCCPIENITRAAWHMFLLDIGATS